MPDRLPAQAEFDALDLWVYISNRCLDQAFKGGAMRFPGMPDTADKAVIGLADGSSFSGYLIGAKQQVVAECVFHTAMSGYQETLTDPSYAKQMVVFTYPHIGNVGVNQDDIESAAVQVSACIIANLSLVASNYRQLHSLDEYLTQQNCTAIAGVDTRSLTKLLREKGALNACIMPGDDAAAACAAAKAWPGISGLDLSCERSCTDKNIWSQATYKINKNIENLSESVSQYDAAKPHIVVIDYGVKQQILRILVDNGCKVTCVPAMSSAEDILNLDPDGILLSNGPGDPAACIAQQKVIEELLKKQTLPVLGICLGFQLLALACGAKSYKMPQGHHGANHPVQDLQSKKVFITSQNHGFAIDEKSLPDYITATHRSLFDNTLQGFIFKNKPIMAMQGHPEASPGPHDLNYIFTKWMEQIRHAQTT